jgi:hypothetical protein
VRREIPFWALNGKMLEKEAKKIKNTKLRKQI